MSEYRGLHKNKKGMPSAFDERRPQLVDEEQAQARWEQAFGKRLLPQELKEEYGDSFVGRLAEFVKRATEEKRGKPWVYRLTKEEHDDFQIKLRKNNTHFIRGTNNTLKHMVGMFLWKGDGVFLIYKPRPMPDSGKRHALVDMKI